KGLVCDIGGNSLELAEVDGKGGVGRRISSQLGPFRLQQIEGGAKGVTAHVASVMESLAKTMGRSHERIYLVGGSWRAIARLDMERSGYPMPVRHEYRMSREAVSQTVRWIGEADLSALRSRLGISGSRMELVPLASL